MFPFRGFYQKSEFILAMLNGASGTQGSMCVSHRLEGSGISTSSFEEFRAPEGATFFRGSHTHLEVS